LLLGEIQLDSSAVEATFEFFKDIPKDESVSEETAAYQKDFSEAKGLIPTAAMPHMLGVSKQRWQQLKQKYNFEIYTHFDKTFVSYPVAMEFSKLHRPVGPKNAAKAIQAMMADMK